MSAPDAGQITFVWTPGQLCEETRRQLGTYFFNLVQGFTMSVELTSVLGWQAVTISASGGPPVQSTTIACVGYQEGAHVPVRCWMDSSGFSGTTSFGFPNIPYTHEPTIGDYQAWLASWWVEILTELTSDVEDVELETVEREIYPAGALTWTGLVKVKTTSEFLVAVDNVAVSYPNVIIPDVGGPIGGLPRPGNYTSAPVVSGSGVDVTRLAQALEDIAMRRQDTSLNHGQAINSSDGITTG